ncbi:hypothetical protein CVT26_011288 [Gymnopilus dilepis]|uniref:Ubiquinol-cytochrome C reductase hinge domain-containing protein n=1 Tax=Gymnopilus dilepis TaxID=231916 RepID=A0A409VJF7_9AGAR|nr:hypothetical protein CVT26_011288 [Gymnopilus dilepis]
MPPFSGTPRSNFEPVSSSSTTANNPLSPPKMSSAISSFFSSFLSTTHSDAEENNNKVEESAPADEQTTAEEPAAEEEAEEEEPEDLQPIIREECKQTPKCAPLLKHFEHCQEKVTSGHGFKGEDCVEELLMHCADVSTSTTPSVATKLTLQQECAAPKVFSKLR